MRSKSLSGWIGAVAVGVGVLAAASHAQEKWSWPDKGENLQVLPEDSDAKRLRAVMTGFSRALGVRCAHCHVGVDGESFSTYDFASDENPKKETAREMLRMLGSINDHLDKIEPTGDQVNMWCHTCHRGAARPQTLEESLSEVYKSEGIDSTIAHYHELRDRYYGRGTFDFREIRLNGLGYQLLGEGDHEAAIAAFRLNAELYPESGNVWDSLAEAYMVAGQKERAIVFYEKSLAINPSNDNAVEKLVELRSGE